MNTQTLVIMMGIAVGVLFLGTNADAIQNTIVTPNSITCGNNTHIASYNSTTGNYTCNNIPINATNISLEGEAISKLTSFANKTTIDDTHFYVDSRFNGVGENLRPSGSQFQIYCDKVENQNCTLWMTSADSKTSALIFSKDIDDEWEKIGAITESNDNKNFQLESFDENGSAIVMIKFYDDRTEIRQPLRIMSPDSKTGQAHEVMRFWNDNRVTWGSGVDRCDIKVIGGYMMCQ